MGKSIAIILLLCVATTAVIANEATKISNHRKVAKEHYSEKLRQEGEWLSMQTRKT